MDLYILAIVFFEAFASYKPYFIKPIEGTADQCWTEAKRENSQQKDLLKSLGDGAEVVCLKVFRQGV